MGHTSDHGFSIMEALVVTGIVTMLAAIALPSFYTLNQEVSLVSAQREVMTVLYLARWNAVANNAPRTVLFAPPQSIQIQDPAHNTIYTRNLNVYGPGITLTNQSAISITYDARGLISPPASFTLTITNAKNQTKMVTVYPTGKATAS
jgi:Tfp pilus assembly protein FimT